MSSAAMSGSPVSSPESVTELSLSIIVPVLNEAENIGSCLQPLQSLRRQGWLEIIVVDGNSDDDTVNRAGLFADQVLSADRGRARQMNAGAARARGRYLLFLHADTHIPLPALQQLQQLIDRDPLPWGRFDVALASGKRLLGLVAVMMNLRSRLTAIATGDQAIFVERFLFQKMGGYADIPLMEDVELCTRLARHRRPHCLSQKIYPSPRKWETQGVWKTIFLMWRLRMSYALGTAPDKLHARYYQDKKAS